MVNSSRNNEDSTHIDVNSPPSTSSVQLRMIQIVAAQTQAIQTIAQAIQTITQALTNVQEVISKQISLPNNNDIIADGELRASIIPSPPSFDVVKLAAMQAQVLQGKMSLLPSAPHIANLDTQTGPVKKQVADAWKSIKKQQKENQTLDICHCCRHYGLPCLQKSPSTTVAEASQRQHSGYSKKRKLLTQEQPLGTGSHSGLEASKIQDPCHSHERIENKDPKVTPEKGTTQAICLDGWSITFKEFQPRRGEKKSKKQASTESKENIGCSGQHENKVTHSSPNQPIRKPSQKVKCSEQILPQHVNSPGSNSKLTHTDHIRTIVVPGAGGSHDDCIRRCFECGEVGHYARKCPMKPKPANLSTNGWLCLKCGEDGHLASWCAKKGDDQPKDQPECPGPVDLQPSSISVPCQSLPINSQPMANSKDIKARACFYCKETGHFISQCPIKSLHEKASREKIQGDL